MTDLAELLASFQRSAFRLETLPHYDVPQEREWFTTFLQTGRLPELTPDNDSWLAMVQEHSQQNRRMARVRIVSTPMTEYERFECGTFEASIRAGEDIRIIERGRNPALELLPDFWLFDETTATALRYNQDGQFQGVEDLPARPLLAVVEHAIRESVALTSYLVR